MSALRRAIVLLFLALLTVAVIANHSAARRDCAADGGRWIPETHGPGYCLTIP